MELPQDVLDLILLDHRFDYAEDRRLELLSKKTSFDANVKIEERLRAFFESKNLERIEKKLNDRIAELASDERNTEGIKILRLNFQRILWNSLKYFATAPKASPVRPGKLDWRFLNPKTIVAIKMDDRWIGQTTTRALLTHLALTRLEEVTNIGLFSKVFNEAVLELPSLNITAYYFSVYAQVQVSATDVFGNFYSADHFVPHLPAAHGFLSPAWFNQKVQSIALTNPTIPQTRVALYKSTVEVEKRCIITCSKALVRGFEPYKSLDGEDEIFAIYSPSWISRHFEFAKNEVFVVRSGKLLLAMLAWESVLSDSWESLMKWCLEIALPEWQENRLVFLNEPEILNELAPLVRAAAVLATHILQKPEKYPMMVEKYERLTRQPPKWIPDLQLYL